MKIGDSGSGSDASRVVTVERVMGGMEVPKLSKANYHEWALEMQVNLEGMELWEAVGAGNAERVKNRRALAVILRGVPPEMKVGLAAKKTAKEAWAAVKSMRMGDDRVQEAKAQLLLKQFENVAFVDGESIDDFAVRLGSLVAELRGLRENVKEVRVVKKLLRVVPAKFNQVACSIEMMMDLKKMSLEELVGRLRVAEERCGGGGVEAAADNTGRLLLIEEQWEERRRQRGGKQRAHGGEGARRGNGERRGGRNDDRSDDDDGGSSTSSRATRRGGRRYHGRCFDCGERGHMAKDCPGKKKALFADADVDVEAALL